jgi:ferredoxin
MIFMKALVDKATCISCGLCPEVCPEVFDMDDDGKAVATESDVPKTSENSAKEAAEGCPVSAITVE